MKVFVLLLSHLKCIKNTKEILHEIYIHYVLLFTNKTKSNAISNKYLLKLFLVK